MALSGFIQLKLSTAFTALALTVTPAMAQDTAPQAGQANVEMAQAEETIPAVAIPSPNGLSGVEGIDAAIELSKGSEVFPITVNLQREFEGRLGGIKETIIYMLAQEGIENVWIATNINNGDSTSITFWAYEYPHKYNIAEVTPEVFRSEAKRHKSHVLDLEFEGLFEKDQQATGTLPDPEP